MNTRHSPCGSGFSTLRQPLSTDVLRRTRPLMSPARSRRHSAPIAPNRKNTSPVQMGNDRLSKVNDTKKNAITPAIRQIAR